MFVIICVLIFACSCLNDWFDHSVARELHRDTGKDFDHCLALVKKTTVARLRERRRENLICLVIGIVVTALLYGCRG